jgi:hypothetical protein
MKLSIRAYFALLWLDDETEPGQPLYRGRGAFAHILGTRMQRAGLAEPGYSGKRHGASQGAANTLVGLKRRGLATNSTPGGEAFQSVEWGITEAGHELAVKIREDTE